MMIILSCFVAVVEAIIGFTEPSYTVLEGQGVSMGGQRGLNMIVRVLSGEIPPGSPVDVTFSTSDLTAIGLPETLSDN